jgi:two-component system, response regulator PdtaR
MTRDTPFEVLIVEDEPMVRMMAADTISASGMVAREAGDAIEALQVLNDHAGVGLLFTDVNLPGEMCGIALSHRVHGECANMEFIITSGGHTVKASELRNSGSFLPKPYSAEQLMELVQKKCAYWRGHRSIAPRKR